MKKSGRAKVLAIIPARSGSKGIKDKNIRLVNGKPLIGYSIEQALDSKTINRVVVSTDSVKYAQISQTFGAEVPFIRPKELSTDASLDIDVFKHVLEYLSDTEGYCPDIVVHLRPTHPVRTVSDIDKMVEMLLKDQQLDSIRSVAKIDKTPFKMWTINQQGRMTPVATCSIPEAYNAPRQILPEVYSQNASIDVIRPEVITATGSMSGKQIGAYIQTLDFDIDTEDDLNRTEVFLEARNKLINGEALTISIDIDGVLANKTVSNDYSKATPVLENIKAVNRLFNAGCNILVFTARGSLTGIDWTDLTKTQLELWGVKYSELIFNKPAASFYVDDRNASFSFLEGLLDEKLA